MNDLLDSPFFGERVVSFVNYLLHPGFQGQMIPINDFEKRLELNRSKLVELNSELDGKLTSTLRAAIPYISPRNALRMLLYLQTFGQAQKGYQIIFFATRDKQVFSENEIARIMVELKKNISLPVELYMAVLAGEEDNQNFETNETLHLPLDFI